MKLLDLPDAALAQVWDNLSRRDKKSVYQTSKELQKLGTRLIKVLRCSINCPGAIPDLITLRFLPAKGPSLLRRDGLAVVLHWAEARRWGSAGELQEVLEGLWKHPQGNLLHLVTDLTLSRWLLNGQAGATLSRALEGGLRPLERLVLSFCELKKDGDARLLFLDHAPVQGLVALEYRWSRGDMWVPRAWLLEKSRLSPSLLRCPSLRTLWYESQLPRLRGRDAAVLAGVHHLERLHLPRSRVCEGGVEALVDHLPHLVEVHVENLLPVGEDLINRPCSWKKLSLGPVPAGDPEPFQFLHQLPLRQLESLRVERIMIMDAACPIHIHCFTREEMSISNWRRLACALESCPGARKGITLDLDEVGGRYSETVESIYDAFKPVAPLITGLQFDCRGEAIARAPDPCSRFPNVTTIALTHGLVGHPPRQLTPLPTITKLIVSRCTEQSLGIDKPQGGSGPPGVRDLPALLAGLKELKVWLPALEIFQDCAISNLWLREIVGGNEDIIEAEVGVKFVFYESRYGSYA